MLTHTRLRELLAYDDATGIFTRRVATSNRVKVGDAAGTVNGPGYVVFCVEGRLYSAHRLAWLYVTGEWPRHTIDHINGIKSDNRWSNLRDVPHATNLENRRRPQRDNALGVLGVHQQRSLYVAHIKINGKSVHIGSFTTPEAAQDAYLKAKRRAHEGCTL